MANIIDYAKTMLEPLSAVPFSAADGIILSWLAYLHFPRTCRTARGCTLHSLYRAELFPELTSGCQYPKDSLELFAACCASPRFRSMTVCSASEQLSKEDTMQFSAVCFRFGDKLTFAAYRGTDATFIGWKEDLLLAVLSPVASQKAACAYLEKISALYNGPLMVGGHSKGGNLAHYAAAMADASLRTRLAAAWSFDGPGFFDAAVLDRLHEVDEFTFKLVPEASMVGMLMESGTEYQIVDSKGIGILQHNPFTWVMDDQNFKYTDSLHADSAALNRMLNDWINQLGPSERAGFIDMLFAVLESTDAESFTGFGTTLPENIPIMLKEFADQSSESKRLLASVISKLLQSSLRTFFRGSGKQSAEEKEDA